MKSFVVVAVGVVGFKHVQVALKASESLFLHQELFSSVLFQDWRGFLLLPRPPAHLPACLFICLPVCLPVCLSVIQAHRNTFKTAVSVFIRRGGTKKKERKEPPPVSGRIPAV